MSEQIQEVDPRVSIDYKFLTSMYLVAILLAVIARETVTVDKRPSGTLATMIPMANTRFLTISKPYCHPKKRKVIPRTKAIPEII